MDERGILGPSMRAKHTGGELERVLQSFPPGSPVAVETSGGAMWALGVVEAAGLEPHLAHALEVKKRPRGTLQNRPMRDTSKPANETGSGQDLLYLAGDRFSN